MSIRLRLTLLYTTILALTLLVFGVALYTAQARDTLGSINQDLKLEGERLAAAVLWTYTRPAQKEPEVELKPLVQPVPFEAFSPDPAFQKLREREIVRVLDAKGNLVASPLGKPNDALPVSGEGLQTLQQQQGWWEIIPSEEGRLLSYQRPVIDGEEVVYIVQVARPLDERDRSLAGLGTMLFGASLVTTLASFGIGWLFTGVALRPIQRITQTAQDIGRESDFSRRVDYVGPKDEIGQLATTFNDMLLRLQEAYQRVSQALKMQRNFVADVSHELRTPLTTVRGNLDLLRRDPPLPPAEQDDILGDLVEESDRLIRLVNDLLILARADAGRGLVHEMVPLKSLVAEACRQARQLDHGREIVESVQDLTALGDRDALKQVLLIILDNALKYSQGSIRVTSEDAGSEVVICVQDEGPGIDPEMLQHLFDRFYRGDLDPRVPGFGLGLPIAKALVEGQGGKVMIESWPGSGIAVSIRLPLAADG